MAQSSTGAKALNTPGEFDQVDLPRPTHPGGYTKNVIYSSHRDIVRIIMVNRDIVRIMMVNRDIVRIIMVNS